ncbi:MAG: cytochrome C peroxidase [Isosphaeraceae bacterium]|nr:cytochrome C peroxidase [Isosphaeraceae bacterium]
MSGRRVGASGLALILGALVVFGDATAARPDAKEAPTQARASHWRRPVALALTDDGRWLYAANRGSGTISVIDTAELRIEAEYDIGRGLSDLASSPDRRFLLAADEVGHRVLLLRQRGAKLSVATSLEVPPYPVSLRISADGSRCTVASLWSRRLTILDLIPEVKGHEAPRLRVARTIDLPFCPRRQALIDRAAKLIVADAFGGGLAVVDLRRGELESVRTLPAHNIGGLALSADGQRLLMTQQLLSALAHTSADDIHWGFLLTNSLRSLRLEEMLMPGADVVPGSRLMHLGEPGDGAGDPAGLAVLPDGRVAVALAGVDQVALGPPEDPDVWRTGVGRRPTAIVASPDGNRIYVANTLDDSVSVVDPSNAAMVAEIALGQRPPLDDLALGERLFYDARLSHEGWMSCHSCHPDGHTNNLRADTLGDDSYGAPKRAPSLLGCGATAPYAWDGGMPDLEGQVRKSVRTSMRGPDLSDEQVRALLTYLRSLSPPPSPIELTGRQDAKAVARGEAVFQRRHCNRCHQPPEYTALRSYDVGLADEMGRSVFNPPSLRGLSQRDALLHDGRARSPEEVLTRFGHPGGASLSNQELSDLIAFLRSL